MDGSELEEEELFGLVSSPASARRLGVESVTPSSHSLMPELAVAPSAGVLLGEDCAVREVSRHGRPSAPVLTLPVVELDMLPLVVEFWEPAVELLDSVPVLEVVSLVELGEVLELDGVLD